MKRFSGAGEKRLSRSLYGLLVRIVPENLGICLEYERQIVSGNIDQTFVPQLNQSTQAGARDLSLQRRDARVPQSDAGRVGGEICALEGLRPPT